MKAKNKGQVVISDRTVTQHTPGPGFRSHHHKQPTTVTTVFTPTHSAILKTSNVLDFLVWKEELYKLMTLVQPHEH